MLLLEHDEDIVVVDCGVAFPEAEQPGIDLILPDITYLRERRDKIRGIFVTHGHEDHIGALPYLLPDLLPTPIFATKLTLGLISVKLEEAGLLARADLREFDPDERPVLDAGAFSVEPFRVCHSIPDAVGFGIETPSGLVVLTGDFKFDETPIDGRLTDYAKLAEFRERGVRLLVSDCVHVETPGWTPSERVVGETYDRVFAAVEGRIFIATFASLIARVQQVIDTAARHGRSVATLGRSLEKNVRMALELGYLADPNGVLVSARDAAHFPDERIVYVVTGSQGEPMAALSRIASGDHREVSVGAGDTVVVSATPIPGNETAVYRVINQLFRAGAEVIYGARDLVHVSGHASRDELRRMIELTAPRAVLPTHGEHRHLALYADLAIEAGIPSDRITFVEIGDVAEITSERVTVTERVESGYVYVDGVTVGAVGDVVVRDRRALARDGILMVVVSVDRETGQIVAGPEIVTRGFVHAKESRALLEGAKAHLRETLASYTDGNQTEDWGYLSRQLRDATATYLFRETRRRPMILPTVMEV
ncbi:MAG: ribonuclease J [Chloroflexota bacterium]|nr:ribonuclease J [Chloroflexota bacterium]